ncbi:MAG TPA: CaiB/BaiF CoA-transferase family protein [Mycobacteriales bacterium]|nr:CaiB/BaiF CoA-transferase family protein [Mycobacteriales bacterium]
MTQLLDGVTVLDLSSVGPASRAAGWLADYGAAVVKVAPIATGTQITPPLHAYSGGRGTRRIRLDLKSDAGRETFLRLAEHADVVLESFRPGVVARLGIGYDDVKSRNPRIVYCSTSGYGQDGERAQWAGHDLNYLAVGGYLAHTEPAQHDKPPLPGATVADSAAGGMQAVIAILAALVGRDRTGDGGYLDVAVADGVLALMALQIDDHLATGATPSPGSAPLGGRLACYDTYPTSDGRWISVAAIETKFWANLCRALGLDDCIDQQYDAAAQAGIRARLTDAFASRSRDEWTAALAGADTCVAPVLSPAEAAHDPHTRARAAVATARTATGAKIAQLAPLLAGAQRRPAYDLPDPESTDTRRLLGDCGFTSEEIDALLTSGAVQ